MADVIQTDDLFELPAPGRASLPDLDSVPAAALLSFHRAATRRRIGRWPTLAAQCPRRSPVGA